MTTAIARITALCASLTPWSEDKARQFANTARSVFYGDSFHNSGQDHSGRESQLVRENCGPCVLRGYEPKGGYEDGYVVKRDGPNYAGWARIYVESGTTIPAHWEAAFWRELHSDNEAYATALRRSVRTFGVRFAG